jgi:oligopeptide transport system ATP-binding protein
MSEDILQVENLNVHFPVRGGLFAAPKTLKAVDGVSFALTRGEVLGIVGESGCGKSTLGRALLRLIAPTAGRVTWMGRDMAALSDDEMRHARRHMQIIFQDPLASLNPRMTVGAIIAEPLLQVEPDLSKAERQARVVEAMTRVGLLPQMINRYPHEFSGGQCQRIGIARAIVVRPSLIVCDEPVSALDVSVQAQVINLLVDLQREMKLSLVFISHDLAVVRYISQRVLVLYLGKVMELAGRDALFARPRHPYSQALIAAIPVPDPNRPPEPPKVTADLPSPLSPPSGCVYRTRCPHATGICAHKVPALEEVEAGHQVACHHWRSLP